MKQIYYSAIFILAFGLLAAAPAEAHQPRLVDGNQLVLIKQPEISQAFYGELKGYEAYYLIDLQQAQDLYFQILTPDLPGIAKDKAVDIKYMNELGAESEEFARLDPASAEWTEFYEELAGDHYWQGPEIKQPAEPGYYVVKVTSPDQAGKYVLVVGEKEEFPPLEAVKAALIIPQLKKNFFNQPLTAWFNGKLGRYFGLGLIGFLLLIFMFHRFNKVYK
ncbi:MAG: hypothetical protein Q8O93_04565 [bacterium]|nr:hypothetical protein [bacterium]